MTTVRIQAAANDDLSTIVGWLEEPRTAKWLDFGASQARTATALN